MCDKKLTYIVKYNYKYKYNPDYKNMNYLGIIRELYFLINYNHKKKYLLFNNINLKN